MNRALRVGADLDGLPDVLAFNDEAGGGALTEHLIDFLGCLPALVEFDFDVLVPRDDRAAIAKI